MKRIVKPTPLPRTTSGAWIRSTLDVLAKSGLDIRHVAHVVGIDLERVNDPSSRWHTDKVSHLWCIAAEQLGPALISKIAAGDPRPSQYGVVGYVMLSSPNMLVGIQRLIDYLALISDASVLRLREKGQTYILENELIGGMRPVPRQRYEFALISFMNLGRWLCGNNFRAVEVSFCFNPPEHLAVYRDLLHCTVKFNAPVNSITFLRETLEMRPRLAMSEAKDVHLGLAKEMLHRLNTGLFPMTIENAIEICIQRGNLSRRCVATELLLSERTFKRRLELHGLSYMHLVDQVRRELALRYLADTQLSLGQIADQLAYSDLSVFTRAFSRWMGMPPSAFRAHTGA